MKEQIEETDLDEREEDVVVQQEGGALSNAPWWLVSVGLHAVLILGATLIAIEKYITVDAGEMAVVVSSSSNKIIQEIERPRDVFERKGIPKDDQISQPTDEPAIFFPEAKESDHNESADNEDYKQMKGDSKDFLSYIKGDAGGFRGRQAGKAPGVYDTMGVGTGGGGGGRYGGRFGGRENLVARGGGSVATESAVLAALKWLARHQGPDGGWGAVSFQSQCTGGACGGVGEKDYDTGLTGLSVLAFLGAGYTQVSKPFPDPSNPGRMLDFGAVVKKGLQWLLAHQDPEGCFGERGMKYMYNHTVAALCLSEAYGMTASSPLKEPAQKGIEFLITAQNPGKGWRYQAKSGDNDVSVTGWAVMALKSAELSELNFNKEAAYQGAINWLNEATEKENYSRVGYNAKGTGIVYVPGHEGFMHHESMSAVAVMSRIFMQKSKKEPTLNAVHLLVQDLPEWKDKKIDFYYWYYATLALFQYDGPDGPMWKKWNEPMKNAIVANQATAKDGCRNGSWNPDVDRWGFEGSRVYGVALNALSLEVYYRYVNVFGTTRK